MSNYISSCLSKSSQAFGQAQVLRRVGGLVENPDVYCSRKHLAAVHVFMLGRSVHGNRHGRAPACRESAPGKGPGGSGGTVRPCR